MTEELLGQFRSGIADVKLIPSGGGVFEVQIDDQLIFSKKELDRFPKGTELSQMISERELL